MIRRVLACGLCGGTLLIACAWCVAVGDEGTPNRGKSSATGATTAALIEDANVVNGKAAKRPATLAEKLETPITLNGFDANTPLKEALEFLSDAHDFTVLIETEGFKAEGVPEIENQPVKLPKLRNVRLKTVLRLLMAQVQGAYLIRPEFVEITHSQRMANEIWGNIQPALCEDAAVGRKRPMMQLVQVEFAKRPLEEALQELAASTGISIVLDARRAGDKAKMVVTARLANTPLDTAVRLLANQAELAAVLIDSVLVVTTPENAKALREEQETLNKKGLEPVAPALAPPAA